MRTLKIVWFFIAVLPLLAIYLCVAAPDVYLCMLWHAVTRGDDAAHRRRMGNALAFWADILFPLFARLMLIRLVMDLPEPRRDARGRIIPAVVLQNHIADLDTLIIAMVVRRMGFRDGLRGVTKRAAKRIPIVGHAARAAMWAFVERRDPKESPAERAARLERDLGRVRRAAAGATADGSCMLIYPEGTTKRPATPDPVFVHVLPPRPGGLTMIVQETPGYAYLCITVHWGTDLTDMAVLESAQLVGRTVTVHAEYVDPPASADAVPEWINALWRDMETRVAALEAARIARTAG